MTERTDAARLRQGLYRYFGEALSPPAADRLFTIAGAGHYIDGAGIEDFPYYAPWRAFNRTVATAAVDELAPEFVSLLASGVDGALCPPTESYYLGHADGGKIARVVAGVQQEYGGMRLSIGGDAEAPDHISTELEAMSILCGREADSREAGSVQGMLEALRFQDRFLRRHLAAWVPLFRARLDEVPAASDFYRTLISALHAFIVHEADFVPTVRRHIEEVAA